MLIEGQIDSARVDIHICLHLILISCFSWRQLHPVRQDLPEPLHRLQLLRSLSHDLIVSRGRIKKKLVKQFFGKPIRRIRNKNVLSSYWSNLLVSERNRKTLLWFFGLKIRSQARRTYSFTETLTYSNAQHEILRRYILLFPHFTQFCCKNTEIQLRI